MKCTSTHESPDAQYFRLLACQNQPDYERRAEKLLFIQRQSMLTKAEMADKLWRVRANH
jgi:hypothetical protein